MGVDGSHKMLMQISLKINDEEVAFHEFEATYDVHVSQGIYEANKKFRENCPAISVFDLGTSVTLKRV